MSAVVNLGRDALDAAVGARAVAVEGRFVGLLGESQAVLLDEPVSDSDHRIEQQLARNTGAAGKLFCHQLNLRSGRVARGDLAVFADPVGGHAGEPLWHQQRVRGHRHVLHDAGSHAIGFDQADQLRAHFLWHGKPAGSGRALAHRTAFDAVIEAPTLSVSVTQKRAGQPLADAVGTFGIVERPQLAAVGDRLNASNLASLFLLASRRAAINNAADVVGRLGDLHLKVDLAGDVVGSLDQSREVHVASRDVCVALAFHRANGVDAVGDFGRFVLQLLQIVHLLAPIRPRHAACAIKAKLGNATAILADAYCGNCCVHKYGAASTALWAADVTLLLRADRPA